MITNIIGGQFITVTHPVGTYYNNTSQPMAGMMRCHSGGKVEVYDGHSWITASGNASVNLTPDAERALSWAIDKQRQEQELEKLSQQHPAVKAAVENLKRAEEQLKATVILSKETAEATQYHPV